MNARLIVLALVMGSFLMGFAADVSAQAASRAAPAGGPKEGIKVHGHWVIEVRNPRAACFCSFP